MIPQLLIPPRYNDARGWFSETYSRRSLGQRGFTVEFVQDNQSFSARRGTLRGIHFQVPGRAQAKLVRCIAGAIWDVAVDLRRGSPTYGRSAGAVLTADAGEQLYVPIGFGHGFLTLTDSAEVAYKVSDYYAPEAERGLIWDDPDMTIEWPINGVEPILSEKDKQLPRLAEFDSPFEYLGTPLAPLS